MRCDSRLASFESDCSVRSCSFSFVPCCPSPKQSKRLEQQTNTTLGGFCQAASGRSSIYQCCLLNRRLSEQHDLQRGALPLPADQLTSDRRRINSVQRIYFVLRARIDELEDASLNAWILGIDQIDHFESSYGVSGLIVTHGNQPIRIISAKYDTSILYKAAPVALPIEPKTVQQKSEEVT